MLQDFFSAPKTPAMQMAALLMAVLVLLLWAPTIYKAGDTILFPFLIEQYGHDFAFPISAIVWLIVFPILFFLLRGSLASSFGMSVMYLADKVGIY